MLGRILAGAALLICAAGNTAWASIEIEAGDDVVISYWSGAPVTQEVGPLWATIYYDNDLTGVGSGHTVKSDFFTFCAERAEHFDAGEPNRYNIYDVTETTVTSNRVLTGYSAWVFEKFLTLADVQGWDKTTPQLDDSTWGATMNLYQNAIWAGLVTPGDTSGAGGTGVGGDGSEYASKLVWNGTAFQPLGKITDWTPYNALGIGYDAFLTGWHPGESDQLDQLGNYHILVVKKGTGDNKQDLVFLTSGGHVTAIPEPASVAIWGLIAAGAVCGTSMARRRRFTGAGAAPKGWNPNNRLAIRQIVERGRRA